MRTKEEILKEFNEEIHRASLEGQILLMSNHLLVEVLIDIRDILKNELSQLNAKG